MSSADTSATYDMGQTAEVYRFPRVNPQETYWRRLREEYALEKLAASCEDDCGRVRAVMHWVHGLWPHDGNNEPQKRDPISILEEAARGKKFRCVEYSIVIDGCLNALGIPCRTVGLMTADVETRESSAGHVVVEAWLRDRGKWIMADGQCDLVCFLDGMPLSALELQQALAIGAPGLEIRHGFGADAGTYLKWIPQYLYYLSVPVLLGKDSGADKQGKLVLVPVGAKQPVVFQRKWPMKNDVPTHSAQAFYTAPDHGATT